MVECPAGNLAGFFMRFTIRDLVLLTAIVAMGAGWIVDRDRYTNCSTIIDPEFLAKQAQGKLLLIRVRPDGQREIEPISRPTD